jgi:general stress protein YciG
MPSNNSGRFQSGSKRASEAGKKGGRMSSGKFQSGSKRAIEAGRLGGSRRRPK